MWLAGGRIAFVRGGALAVLAANGVVTPVMHALRGVSQLAASADGASLAFVAEGTLWVMPAGALPHRLVPAARKLAVESFQWARDGKRIAFVLADQRQMAPFTEEEQSWIQDQWLAESQATDHDMVAAVLLPDDVFARLSANQVMNDAREGALAYHVFLDELEDALWLSRMK